MIVASNAIKKYFEDFDNEINKAYALANKARTKGYDPETFVDIPLAQNMAERVVGLISIVAPQVKDKEIEKRIEELEKQYGRLDWRVALTISLEIAQEKFCKFKDKREAMEVGIRFGLAYITLGVVVSPLEGFVRLELKKRRDGKEYFALYYSGPIRSAGGTGASVSVVVADYIRLKMGYESYDATKEEVNRSVTEVKDYHERITNLQYLPSDEEIVHLASNLPVQITGDPSEKFEVSNHKDLDRIETNLIRNGFCLVFAECFAQKAKKVNAQLQKWGKDFFNTEWNFLDEFLKIQQKSRAQEKTDSNVLIKPDYTYIKDLVAGRPVFTYPLAKGGFRLRYGRGRNTGLSAQAIHPATMFILNNFIAIGTQLKVERPGKACVVGSCDSIEGPIVKLRNGDVLFLEDPEQAKKVAKDVEEILFLGDILINYGDFLNRAHKLVPCGYNEDWFSVETGIKEKKISVEEAKKLCLEKNLPLHPRYLFRWSEITKEQFNILIEWLRKGAIKEDKLVIPYNQKPELKDNNLPKRILELVGVSHKYVLNEYVVIEGEWKEALMLNLGGDFNFETILENAFVEKEKEITVLDILNEKCKYKIRDKSGTSIGARMGRPEKAKIRKLTGSPQILFAVGNEGGKTRSFNNALAKGKINSDFPNFLCETCNKETVYSMCENCGNKCIQKFFCTTCKKISDKEECCGRKTFKSRKREIDINNYLKNALKILDTNSYPELIKGVRGTSSSDHIVEHLVKGILRAKYGLYVNKDGTIRYDMIEMSLTHFKPREIGLNLERLKKLGYEKDVYGNEITNDEQIIEMKPQDIVIPCCPDTLDERCDDIMLKITRFIDELLEKLYKVEKYYNLKTKEDLIGQLVISLSPHTSSGIVSRIIGFSKTQGFLAHPYLHSLMRRDCFTYETYLPIMKNGIWKNVKIGEIVEELKPDKKVDSFGTFAKKVDGYYTIGIGKDGKPTIVKVNDFTKHQPSKILMIKTQDGRELNVTENHKFLIKENGSLKQSLASELKEGTQLVVPINYPAESKDVSFIDLSLQFANRGDIMIRNVKSFVTYCIDKLGYSFYPFIKNNFNLTRRAFYNYLSRDSFPLPIFLALSSESGFNKLPKESYLAAKRDHVNLPTKIPMNEEILNIIGLYVAEGYARRKPGRNGLNQVDFSASEKAIRVRIKKVMKKYFKLNPSNINKDRITYSSRILYELFVEILKCGRTAYKKRIPEIIMNLPLDKLKFFLQGYFDGDGSVSDTDSRVTCDSVSEQLLQDLEFCLRRYGIYSKRYWYKKKPGPQVRKFYIKKNREIPEFEITKLIIPSNFYEVFYNQIGFSLERKQKILRYLIENTKPYGMRLESDDAYVYPEIKEIKEKGIETSYCLDVDNHVVSANGLFVKNCDGDEATIMMLMDVLLNFSKKYLPKTKGATQDEPLLLSSKLLPTEVDDMVFDMDVAFNYPLEFYEAALQYKNPGEIKISKIKDFLDTEKQYEGFGFTHDTSNINKGVLCSAYKSIPSMSEKVKGQLDLAKKIRAVIEQDVARLVVEKHFIRDIKGNLRKFSTQQFRCVECNAKFRRPPLSGICLECGGKLLFTVAEGFVLKYLNMSLELAENYDLPLYLKQNLEITKKRIEGLFGKEKDKQKALIGWFN